MAVRIWQEQGGDLPLIRTLVETAFADVRESDHREHLLVERLHRSGTFTPQLSLVAQTEEGNIVGYILLTRVEIAATNGMATSLAVAPLAVLPEFQKKGIGGMLLQEAHRRAASLGYGTAVLLGHKDYYPRFGYRKAIDFGVEFPFDVPCDYCMIAELLPDATRGLCGRIRYPDAFFEEETGP